MMKRIYKILPAIFITIFIAVHVNAAQEFVGSKTSNKYHYPTCKWVKEIKPRNLIKFDSPEQAAKADYIPCPTCHPPLPVTDKTTNNTITPKSAKQNLEQAPANSTVTTDSAKQNAGRAPSKSFDFNIVFGFLLLFLLLFIPFLPGLFEIMTEDIHLPRLKRKKDLTK